MKNAPEIPQSLLQELAVAILDSMERVEKNESIKSHKNKKTSTLFNKAFTDYKNEKGQ